MMRKFFSLLLFIAGLTSFLISCNSDTKYICGQMTSEEFNGCKAYLYTMFPESKLVDSTTIDGTVFGFDIPDTLNLYKVKVLKKNNDMVPIVVPLVSGEGKVNIYLGDKVVTTGTISNDRLQDFLLALDFFYESAINSGKTKDQVVNEFKAFLQEQVRLNRNNIVSVYIICEFRSRFSPDVYNELVAGLDDKIQSFLN